MPSGPRQSARSGSRLPFADEVGEENAEEVEEDHGDTDEELCDGLRWGDDGSDDETEDDGEAPPAQELLVGNDAKACEAHDDEWRLEDHAHDEDDAGDEPDVVSDAPVSHCEVTTEVEEEAEGKRQNRPVGKGHPGEEGERGSEDDGKDPAPFRLSESRGDEAHGVVDDHGHGDGDAAHERDSEVGEQVLHRLDELRDEIRVGVARRDEEKLDGAEADGRRKEKGHADDDGGGDPGDACPEFEQVLDEGHLPTFGGLILFKHLDCGRFGGLIRLGWCLSGHVALFVPFVLPAPLLLAFVAGLSVLVWGVFPRSRASFALNGS